MALSLDFILQIILFCPLLICAGHFEKGVVTSAKKIFVTEMNDDENPYENCGGGEERRISTENIEDKKCDDQPQNDALLCPSSEFYDEKRGAKRSYDFAFPNYSADEEEKVMKRHFLQRFFDLYCR